MRREWVFLCLWMFIYILVRSQFFIDALNFSQDQAADSLRGMELLSSRTITLIGTHIGYTYNGRLLFLGPLFIYTYLAFNLLGHFDPILSSYLFMIAGSIGIIPLYYGLKRMTTATASVVGVAFYTLMPYFIDYSRFLWNPNFQLVSSPFLVYTFARYYTSKSRAWLFATSVVMGVLLQHHYQYFFVILAFLIYLIVQKQSIRSHLLNIAGLAVGFLPVIVFELRHSFYNLRTAILFIQHYREVFIHNDGSAISAHFFLSLSLLFICFIIVRFQKRIGPRVAMSIVLLLGVSAIQHIHQPDRMFNSQIPWQYEDEQRVYNIIHSRDLSHTNVTMLQYDNEALVQKFFLTRDKRRFANDYYNNQQLFAVAETGRLDSYQAYEIRIFKPRSIVQSWPITDRYTLYLLQKDDN